MHALCCLLAAKLCCPIKLSASMTLWGAPATMTDTEPAHSHIMVWLASFCLIVTLNKNQLNYTYLLHELLPSNCSSPRGRCNRKLYSGLRQ